MQDSRYNKKSDAGWWRFLRRNEKNSPLNESVEEAKGDPKGAEKLMRRDVEKDPRDDLKADPLITDWCQQFGYTPYQTMKNEFNPFLGEGAQGRVYGVTKGGKLYAVKLVSLSHGHGAEDEFKIRNKFGSIYTKLPEYVRKHLPKIYDMGMYDVPEEIAEEGNSEYYYYVMEFLQPLEGRYYKYFKGGFEDKQSREVDISELDIFSVEKYGDIKKKIDSAIDNERNNLLNSIFAPPFNLHLEKAEEKKKDELINLFKLLFNDIFYKTWRQEIKKEKLKRFKTSGAVIKYITDLLIKATKKETAAIERLINIAGRFIEFKKQEQKQEFNQYAKRSILEVVYKLFSILVNQLIMQHIPFSYYKDPKTGEATPSKSDGITHDVDLLRSGPVTEFRNAMMYLVRNHNINVDDIKEANVMQRGKDIVMVDIGVWDLMQ